MVLLEVITGFNYERPAEQKYFKSFASAKKYGLKMLSKKDAKELAVFIYGVQGEKVVSKFELYPSGVLDEYHI